MERRRGRSNEGAVETKPSYKIVHELVTREKKQLNYELTEDQRPPHGYTLVPVGLPDLTDFCKERSREAGKKFYVVNSSLGPRRNTSASTNLELDRIGYHFENSIAAEGWERLDSQNRNRISDHAHGRRLNVPFAGAGRDLQLQQVRATIMELFPKIPETDLEQVMAHAFAEGADTVGNAEDMPLSKKVQLAVNAHIRHAHTPYDTILGYWRTDWQDRRKAARERGEVHLFDEEKGKEERLAVRTKARADIEQACYDLLRKWRGEDQNGPKEFEEIFKEVIVIDDDDDVDEDLNARQPRGKPISKRIEAPFAQFLRPQGQGCGTSSSKRKSSANAHFDVRNLDDERREADPPEIQEPQRTSTVPINTPELVHVRPKRTIPTSQLSNMDDVASNPIPQERIPGLGILPHSSPRAPYMPHDSPALNNMRTGRQIRPDSVLSSIETTNQGVAPARTTKRQASFEETYQRKPKVIVIDEVPESEIVYRGSRNQHRSGPSQRDIVRPSAGDQADRLRYTEQSWQVFQNRRNLLPDNSLAYNVPRTIHDKRYAQPTNQVDQPYDIIYQQPPSYPPEKVFYEIQSDSDQEYYRPMTYRELPIEYLQPRSVYRQAHSDNEYL